MKVHLEWLGGAVLVPIFACTDPRAPDREASTIEQPIVQAKETIRRRGCPACHVIPGIPEAQGNVGPSLERVGTRAYIGGVLLNNPGNLDRWLDNPVAIDPQTAMPTLGLSPEERKVIVDYLYQLR